ncbi:MAG: tRNA adenosine(34) deaminase TadA [Abyssibacter sp.]|jgi:tRNA(adenine34) deaminase|uniref:tRNA adenosine(34) deaminase TadA n=1 Tax=Abyssibacter sp. TaxID=2320200 RepID=UPI003219DA11
MSRQAAASTDEAQEAVDRRWMQHALSLARRAAEAGEVPVGAVIVRQGQLLSEGWNRPIELSDPTAHAEIQALRAAAASVGNYRLVDCDLYVTLEPCAMCAGAIITARVRRVIYGADDLRAGAAGSVFDVLPGAQLNHRCELHAGLEADASAQLLRAFFRARRKQR